MVSNFAIQSNSQSDAVYNTLEGKIAAVGLASATISLRKSNSCSKEPKFGGLAIDEQQAKQLIADGRSLLDGASCCAANLAACAQ